jgi:hypothetical protein
MVRSKTWAASPQWEQMRQTPFVGGPSGGEPHVGCSIQYNALWQDGPNGSTYFAFWVWKKPLLTSSPNLKLLFSCCVLWLMSVFPCHRQDVSFFPANRSTPAQSWHLYELDWTNTVSLPMQWPGPPQSNGTTAPDCSTNTSCKATCAGYVECPTDGIYYCCAAPTTCSHTHNCVGHPGLHFCACN